MPKVIHTSVTSSNNSEANRKHKKKSSANIKSESITKKSNKKSGSRELKPTALPISAGKSSITKKKKKKRVTIKRPHVKLENISSGALEEDDDTDSRNAITEETTISSLRVLNVNTGNERDDLPNPDQNTNVPVDDDGRGRGDDDDDDDGAGAGAPISNSKAVRKSKKEKPTPDEETKDGEKKRKSSKKKKTLQFSPNKKESKGGRNGKKIKATDKLSMNRIIKEKRVRGPRRRRARVDKRIRDLQKSVDPVLQKKPFERLTRYVLQLLSTHDYCRVKKSFVLGLQEYIEARIVSLLIDSKELTLHRGFKTTNIDDLRLAYKRLSGKVIPG